MSGQKGWKVPKGITSGLNGAPTFPLNQRLFRLLWNLVWIVLASWTPPKFRAWRRFLLNTFGAHIHCTAGVRGSVKVWYPPNLKMGPYSSLGPGVNCYNVDHVELLAHSRVSQNAFLCTASHELKTPAFMLKTKSIRIGQHAWVCAEAYVGPGVEVGDGAVLGARAVAFNDMEPWSVYIGNPAQKIKDRAPFLVNSAYKS